MPPDSNQNSNQTLDDKDNFQVVRNFKDGYQNNSDVTSVDPWVLVPPSQNVLITGDTIKCVETRAGYKLLGSPGAVTGSGIRSKYDDFVNGVGIKLPIKEWLNPFTFKSVFEVFYIDPTTGIGDWYVIRDDSNIDYPHEIYFTEWWDDINVVPKLLFTGGATVVGSWNGGISQITNLTGTTIDILDPIASFNFPPTGNFDVLHNGVPITFSYTGFTGNTFTGVTPNPLITLTVGDILTQPIIAQSLFYLGTILTNPPTLDICGTLNNHPFFGSYSTRLAYVANSFATGATTILIATQTTLDDLVISGTYVNTTQDTLKIEIITIPVTPSVTSSVSAVTNFQDVHFDFGPLQSGATGGGGLTFNVVIEAGGATFQWNVNGGAYTVGVPCTITPTNLSNNVTVAFGRTAGYTPGDVFTLYIGNTADVVNGNSDFYTVSRLVVTGTPPNLFQGNFAQIQGPTPITTPFVYNGNTFTFQTAVQNTPYGHKVGDSWTIELTPAVNIPYVNIYFSLPARKPGQGAVIHLDAIPIAFIPQENLMYVSERSGLFQTLEFQTSADLLTEEIVPDRLKTSFSNKVLKQGLVTHTKDSIAYINIENQLVDLGRVVNQFATPMSEILSQPIQNDFSFINFIQSLNGVGNAHINFADNKLFVCVPSVGFYWIYDYIYEFWQPPQTGQFSSVSVINGQICAHSAISNETYILFSASNDNGFPFESIMALPYNSDGRFPQTLRMLMNSYEDTGRRDRLKEYSKFFIEAYKTANTNLYGKVNLEWGNCLGGPDLRLDPKICAPIDRASLGKSDLGKHGLANDPLLELTKFHFFQPFNRQFAYEAQLIFHSSSPDNYWKVVSCGTNATLADQRNVVAQTPAGTQPVPISNAIAGTPKPEPWAGGVNIPGNIADSTANGGAS